MRKNKRPILLLEVLIAFALIVLCIFPLIYPHAVMARSQREYIKKIELDQAVALSFGQIYQDLLTNKIEWSDIDGKRRFDLTPQDLQNLNHGKSLPFKGYYYFDPVIHKPKTLQDTTAYIYNLIFKFLPLNVAKNHRGRPLEYKYRLFILRDLRAEKEPHKQDESENRQDEKKEQTKIE